MKTITKTKKKYIIKKLWDLGHFFNPAVFPEIVVKATDLDKLDLDHDVVKKAVASWQDMMAVSLDRLSAKHHSRPALHDGEIGPATLESFDEPRCGMPDYHPSFKAVGSGSWPEPCQKAGVSFSVATSGQPSITQQNWAEILANVVATYAKVGLRLLPYTGSGQANIRVSWRGLAGSTIGLAEFNNRSCSDSVFCYLDTGFNANKFAIMDLLCHEMGHNMNLNHTRGGIMNASLGSVNSFSGWTNSDPSWNTLVRYFGGEPLDPDPIPGPIGELAFRSGIFYIDDLEVGRINSSGGVTYVPGVGDVIYQNQTRGRLIMIPPA